MLKNDRRPEKSLYHGVRVSVLKITIKEVLSFMLNCLIICR